MTEYFEWEGAHKDHQVQLLIEQPIQKSNPQPAILSTPVAIYSPLSQGAVALLGGFWGASDLLLTVASPLQ